LSPSWSEERSTSADCAKSKSATSSAGPTTTTVCGSTVRRVGDPADIAYAALYLTSDESAYVTGSALAVDGGRTFH
jgi:NAD(P)-dependent dehydrogenase (short-subunit alcohol dehydrogenase family)